ncbi:MAG: M16 family metallopeptidase [Nitrospinota bacterium]
MENRFEHALTKLSGGLRCLTVPIPSSKSITLMVLVRAGSRYETRDDNGISHFMEHMFFKGAEKYPDTMAVASAIDGSGGSFNAFTSEEMVGYFVKISSAKMETAYDVLSDMLLKSRFNPEEIQRERGVIVEEIRMHHDDPMSQVHLDYHSLILGDQPLGWDIAGTEEVVSSATRDMFLQHHERFYYGANMVICAAGDIDPKKNEELCNKYFVYTDSSEPAKPDPFKKLKTDRVFAREKATEQAHFIFGFQTCGSGHDDETALKVMNTVLGGAMSSRLFYQIRERRGLAYYIHSSLSLYNDVGLFHVSAGVNLNKVEEALKCAVAEIEKITAEEIPEEELNRAKQNINGHTDLALEDSRRVASLYGMREILHGKIKTPEELTAEVNAVTSKQILNAARRYLVDDEMKMAVIGPYKNGSIWDNVFRIS